MEKCTGENRPESEPEQDRIFENWGVNDGYELKLQGEKVKRTKNFKYLGSTVSSDGRCEEEVRRWIQAGWMSWRKVSGVLCERKLSAKVKGKMYKSVVRPAILYGMETVAETER